MSSIATEKFSNLENVLALSGTLATGMGTLRLAEGEIVKGVAEIVLGNYSTTLAALQHSEEFQHRAMAGNLIASTFFLLLNGFWNTASTVPAQARRGYTQVAVAAAGFYIGTSLSPRILSIFNNTIMAASVFGCAAHSGIKDIAKGKPISGATKALLGAGGVLLSGAAAYCEITNSLA